ncbi:EamA family transporter [Bartonella sp. DGB1]|uniref:EamA family transporter n=1 Tax=Bartonella sp. DGB1 TaxID=3239807 RepID=UPI0035261290
MRQYFGYIAACGWCFITAFSMLLTSEVSQRLSPFIVCFFTFFLANLIFLVYNICNIRSLWRRILKKSMLSQVFGINVSSFAGWGLMIYPLTYLQPTLVATLILGINPIATVVISRLFFRQASPKKLEIISLALFSVIFLLSVQTFHGENNIFGTSHFQMIMSLLCCYLSGIATSVNNILTKKIMMNGFSITDVMCSRFYLTIIISGIVGFSTHKVAIDQDLVFSVFITTMTFVIVPLVLLQVALKKLDPLRVAIISPLMPVLLVIMQLYNSASSIPDITVGATLVIWLLVSLGTYWAMRKV